MTTSLGAIPFGTTATIGAVQGERGFRRRLLELGFLPGTPVRLIAAAPMGDPLDVEVRGCRFSLRRAEAAMVEVETVELLAAAK